MDEAHALAEQGAPAGTCVLADRQRLGRGRGGNRWQSQDHRGVWLTLIERPSDAAALDVLSLRLGLAIAQSLETVEANATRDPDGSSSNAFTLKWPNDVFKGDGKIAGVLVEARWREQSLEWVAIGVGINLAVPAGITGASAVRAQVSRDDVLRAVVPALRIAAAARGVLTSSELSEWHRRDRTVGCALLAPVVGVSLGITPHGALRVATGQGTEMEVRSGSLRLVD